jgi:hypothetical protein
MVSLPLAASMAILEATFLLYDSLALPGRIPGFRIM